MANHTVALARSGGSSRRSTPMEDGGKSYRDENDAKRIIHVDGNGRQTVWNVDQLKREFRYDEKKRQAVPLSVRIEFARIRLETNYKREDFLREIFPRLRLDATVRFELAQLYLSNAPRTGQCDGLPDFGIQDAEQQLALAELCIEKQLNLAPVFAATLNRVSPDKRRDLAFRLVKSDPDLSPHVGIMGLDGPDQFELVLSIARHSGAHAVLRLPDSCVADKAQALQIAQACGPCALDSTVLRKLGMSGESAIRELVRHFARQHSLALSENLDTIDVLTVEQKFELMEECLRAGGPVCNADLVAGKGLDPEFCFRWVLACAKHDAKSVACRFPANEILSKRHRLQIAWACVERDAFGVGRFLDNFDLDDPTELLALGLACANEGLGILDALPGIALPLPDKLQILRACSFHAGFNVQAPVELLAACTKDQLLDLVDKVVEQNASGDVFFISRLLQHKLLAPDEAMPALRLCVSKGSRPKDALAALQLDESARSIAMEFLGIWLQTGAASKTLKKECSRHQRSFEGEGSDKLLRPLSTGASLTHRQASDTMTAIGGGSSQKLGQLSDEEIALLATLAHESTFSTFFIKGDTTAGQAAWLPKADASFTNVIGRLKSRGVRCDAPQCRITLNKLAIAGDATQARQIWKEIGQRAQVIECFREFARMKKPKSLPQPEPVDADGLTWTDHQLRWLASVLIQIDARAFIPDHVRRLIPLLQRLEVMKDEKQRRVLTRLALETPYAALLQLETGTAADVLPRLCMLPFMQSNPWLGNALDIDAKRGKRIKNYEIARGLMEAFTALREFPLPLNIKNSLLMRIAPAAVTTLEAISALVQKLTALMRLSLPDALKLLANGNIDTLDTQLRSALSVVLSYQGSFDVDRYIETFGSMRNPSSLPVYASRMKSQPQALQGLSKFVQAVLNGEYPAIRYRGIELLERMDPAWLQRWRNETVQSLNGKPLFVAPASGNPLPTPVQIIKSRILDYGHLELAHFPYLARHLGVPSAPAQQAAAHPISVFETAMIAWLQTPDPGQLEALYNLLGQAQPDAELRQDLGMLLAELNGELPSKAGSGWVIRATDDFSRLLSMGETAGSCQRVDGPPRLTRGLIGTILDGRSRMCLIEDEAGKIQGRLILRLVWNETNNQPCLLAEPIYPDTLSRELRDHLTSFARDRARELQLDLICFSTPIVEADFHIDASMDRFEGRITYGQFEYPPYIDSAKGVADQQHSRPDPEFKLWRAYRHWSAASLEMTV